MCVCVHVCVCVCACVREGKYKTGTCGCVLVIMLLCLKERLAVSTSLIKHIAQLHPGHTSHAMHIQAHSDILINNSIETAWH